MDIPILPLLKDGAVPDESGWAPVIMNANEPDLEVIGSGMNSKSPNHVALWRQGHLLHFGFEESPEKLNAAGRALLVNSIAYIARFTEDRPIGTVLYPYDPSAKDLPRMRWEVELTLKVSGFAKAGISHFFAGDQRTEIDRMTEPAFNDWYARERAYLHATEDGDLEIDGNAKLLGVPTESPEFFRTAIEAIRGDSEPKAKAARALLGRAVEGGPGGSATAEAWDMWIRENGRYIFFSEDCGYRWLLDPLAKARAVPSAKLRGAKRATLGPFVTSRPAK